MATVPGGTQIYGVVGSTPTEVRASGPSQGGYTWLTAEGANTVEGTMDGALWTALTGDTVAGTISRYNIIGLTSVRISGAGAKFRLVA
jgi:hypothetical protein